MSEPLKPSIEVNEKTKEFLITAPVRLDFETIKILTISEVFPDKISITIHESYIKKELENLAFLGAYLMKLGAEIQEDAAKKQQPLAGED